MRRVVYSRGVAVVFFALAAPGLAHALSKASDIDWLYNEIPGVVLCFSSFNSGSNQISNDDNPLVYNQNYLKLSTASPNYWTGINYDMRDGSCTPLCSTSCTYLGNINIVANSSGVSYTGGSSSSALTNLGLVQTKQKNIYNLVGNYTPTVPLKNQTVTNGTNYLLCNGKGAGLTYSYDSHSKQPVSRGALRNGDSVTMDAATGGWANFNVRIGGCSQNASYYGNITFATVIANNIASLVNPPTTTGPVSNKYATIGMTATCDPFSGSGAGYGCTLDNLVFTPPAQVPLSAVKTYQQSPGILYRGVNLSGSEFGDYWSPSNTPYPSELNYYITKGMNTVRMPIRWAYAQPQGPGAGALDKNYMNFVGNLLENLTQAGVHVIVDLHDYQRYAPQGEVTGVPAGAPTGSAPDGQINTSQQLASIWTSLITAFESDQKINMDNLIFDISNEPSQMDTATILANENAAIAAIRAAGSKSLILVEGNVFSGMWAWETSSTYNNGANTASPSATVFLPSAIVDPANNYAINVHQYFDSNDSMSGTTQNCIPANTLLTQINATSFLSWVNDNKVKVFVSEFGVGRGTDETQEANCMADLKVFIDWMQKNAYTSSTGGFVGWTMWSAGHAWGGYNTQGQPSYILDVSPNPNNGADSPQVKTLEKFNFLS